MATSPRSWTGLCISCPRSGILGPTALPSLVLARHRLGRTCKRVLQNDLTRLYAVVTTQTGRPCRDVASLLDAPQNKDSTPRRVDLVAHIRSVRAQKKRVFLALADGSTSRSLQALLDPSQAAELSTGTAVRISGLWAPSPARGQTHELRADAVEVLGPTNAESFPIQKKHLTSEFLRSIPHLRPRTTTNALLARLRSECEYHSSNHFRKEGFVRLHPPVITSSDCEGAGEVFSIQPRQPVITSTTTPESRANSNTSHARHEEFFKAPKYLTVSSQLHLEAFVHEHQRVWALAPTFRAEKSDTPRHLSEFYMLEAELRCSSLSEVMDVVENLVKAIAKDVQESRLGQEMISEMPHPLDEQTESRRLEKVKSRFRGLRQPYWPRITYTQALRILEEAARDNPDAFVFKPSWTQGLHSEHERYLASFVGNGSPVFVTDYPKHQKPFYMLPTIVNSDSHELGTTNENGVAAEQRWTAHSLPPKPTLEQHLQEAHPTVSCFDLLLPDVGELVGGSLREHRHDVLAETMEREKLTNLAWYLELRKYGSVPHGGFGLGFDRLLMYLSAADSVRDVVQWPRYFGRCDA